MVTVSLVGVEIVVVQRFRATCSPYTSAPFIIKHCRGRKHNDKVGLLLMLDELSRPSGYRWSISFTCTWIRTYCFSAV